MRAPGARRPGNRRRRRLVGWLAWSTALAVMVGGLAAPESAAAAPADEPPPARPEPSVAVRTVLARQQDPEPHPEWVVTRPPTVAWPEAGEAALDLGGSGAAPGLARVGALPVLAGRASVPAAGQDTPTRIAARVLDRAAAAEAGVDGLVLRVVRADGEEAPGRVRLAVDYGRFRSAFGGDWGSRLRLARLPDCALSTPDKPACRPEPLPSHNDAKAGRVAADATVVADGDGGLFAVIAGASGAAGDLKATALSPSATWSAGGSSGDFTWSYPLRVPPSTGGDAPELALAYASGSVDGRTASTNNQASWVGEGFDLSTGFVERRYKACADDLGGNNGQTRTGDLCWGTENAFLSLGGKAGELIRDDATGAWRLKHDDGSRVERLFSTPASPTDDNNGEHWRITASDGTQYLFGSRPASSSRWTVPVFGNHAGEDCHQSGFAASWCYQAYRWNLDLVVDPNGNSTTLSYQAETNLYGRNLGQAGTSYHRGGWLERVEYGTNTAHPAASAPARVVFTPADRCITPGSTCVPSNVSNWPDVPSDQMCTGGTCPSQPSPTFWTRKRLAAVTTQVWGGTGYRDVDSWTLTHQFLDPGDTSSPSLWLEAIRHTGQAGAAVTLPEVNFNPEGRSNRVDGAEGLLPLVRFRIASILNGTGGQLAVTYLPVECVRGGVMPASPDSNTRRCFPVYWTPEGAQQPLLDWFHKTVVASVTEHDDSGGGRPVLTTYQYPRPPAWHYDDEDGLLPASRKTWSQYRGYDEVVTVTGDSTVVRARTLARYLRGMDDDRTADGRRDVWITDSLDGRIEDQEPLAGRLREQLVYKADGDPTVLSGSIIDPWISPATATSARPWGTERAYLIDTASTRDREALESGGWRNTQTVNTFNPQTGLLETSSDLGELGTAADDRCTRTSYAQNQGKWMLSYVSRVETVGVACSAPASYPADLLSDERTFYDDLAYGAAPARGNVTRVEEAASWSAGPRYVAGSRARHDAYGRVVESWDGAGERSTTAYTPATAGPLTRTVTTNPLGHTTTTDLDPAWGVPTKVTDPNQRVTELAYDALGRLSMLWTPGRSRATQSPSGEFQYLVRTTGANVVVSKTLRPDGATYNHTYALSDGLLRPRQTQTASPGPDGGRIVTESHYDSRGTVVKANGPYFNSGPPDTALLTPVSDLDVPAQTLTVDLAAPGATTATASVFRVLGVEQRRTVTTSGGDRVHVDVVPPNGSVPTTTVIDARGQAKELRQYTAGSRTGPFQTTTYAYTDRGELARTVDPAGNAWQRDYDLRGLVFRTVDPDKGTTTLRYDDAGRLAVSTDARGLSLAYGYDRLSRKVSLHEGQDLTAPKLAAWTYDRPDGLGLPATSTRFVPAGGAAYVKAISGYDAAGRPTGTTVTIPAAEGALSGGYSTAATYHPDGSLATLDLPEVGGLPAELLSFGYDSLGLPDTLTGASPYVKETDYTEYGELSLLTASTAALGNKTWQRFHYERGTRRLAQALLETQTTVRQQGNANYTYDPAGNVTRIADVTANRPADVQCFRYDALRRLADAWTPGTDDCGANPTTGALGGPAPYWHTYRHDAVGNRVSEVQHAAAGDTTRTYTYPSPGGAQPHTLRTVTTSRPGASPTTDSYGYDNRGQTISRAVAGQAGHVLTWDAEGRLASDTAGTQRTTFVYDADGARLLRRDPTHITLYLDGTELRLNRSTGAITGTRYYGHAGVTVGVRTGARVTWLAADHHGTAQLAVDASSLQVVARRSLPFGGPRGAVPSSWPGERGFVGGTQDAATGLTQLGARHYDPSIGQFASADPIMNPADPQQLQGYGYANGNPATWSDPSGLLPNCGGPDGINCLHPASYEYDTVTAPGGNRRVSNPARTKARRTTWRTTHRKANTWRFMGPKKPGQQCNLLGKCYTTRPLSFSGLDQQPNDPGCKWRDCRPKTPNCGGASPFAVACPSTPAEELRKRKQAEEAARARKEATDRTVREVLDRLIPKSVSFCVTGSAAAIAAVSGEACLAFDQQGVGWTAAGSRGVGLYPAGATVGLMRKNSQANIDQLGGHEVYVDAGVPIRNFDVNAEVSVDPETGLLTGGAGVGVGVGLPSASAGGGAEDGASGRFFDWCILWGC